MKSTTDKTNRFTKGVESLMENSSHDKAAIGSKVDKLPVAFSDSSDLGIAEMCWVDSIPHVRENQVGTSEAAVHLTERHVKYKYHDKA